MDTNTKYPRQSGILFPLFSCPSTTSWGIGDIGDLRYLARWLSGAGQRVLQLLPIHEMAPGQQSPYSAISAMAIDPVFICVAAVPEFAAMGGEASLSGDERQQLADVRQAGAIDYVGVRKLKDAVLRRAFDRFVAREWTHDTVRAQNLRSFLQSASWWLADYALFRAIHAQQDERPWTSWPAGIREHDPAELERVQQEVATEILFYQYLQWVAATQWQAARDEVAAAGVQLFGDLAFMVNLDSADVWIRQREFRLDVSIGAPPDAFSATGQNWGPPLYRWDVIADGGFEWLHERARREAELFDGYRIDHLVGFYRTFSWPKDGSPPFFFPADEPAQLILGERVLGVFQEPGSTIIAEDLGTIPDFVRESLSRLGIPGFRVFRWERHWHTEGQPFREPTEYPALSVATSGTHDTEPLSVWWDTLDVDERQKIADLETVQRLTAGSGDAWIAEPFDDAVRDVLLETLFSAGSNLLLFPVQDIFGWRDRINDPSTGPEVNWTYRMPWASDRLDDISEARDRQAALRRWSSVYGRASP
jgi:4-alpha-glucanotransferase